MEDFKARLRVFARDKLSIIFDDIGSKRGIITCPASYVSEEIFAKFLNIARSFPFVALSRSRANKFGLEPMSNSARANDFSSLVSVEAREGIASGISAYDRALTISILAESQPLASKLVKPGHIFPVITRDGGVLVNAELAEAALDITKLSGATDAALFMDLLDEHGELLNLSQLKATNPYKETPIFLLSELIRYRLINEKIVQRVSEAKLPTELGGDLKAILYRTAISNQEHIALVKGTITTDSLIHVRVQTESTFNDIFGSVNNSRGLIENSLKILAGVENGVFLYLRKSSVDKSVKNSDLMRDYGIGAEILRDLSVTKIVLLTNNRKSIDGLSNFNIEILKTELIS